MKGNAILVNVGPGETRVAMVEEGKLLELAVQRISQHVQVGQIYIGRVVDVVTDLNSAFVDIGLVRPAFLGASNAALEYSERRPRIEEWVREGDSITVQITRVPVADKGARVTRRPTLAGRYLVYTPLQPDIRVSRRIADKAAEDRICDLLETLDVEGGCIVRTRAMVAEDQQLVAETERLAFDWQIVERTAGDASIPSLISPADEIAYQKIIDLVGPGWNEIVIDDQAYATQLRSKLRGPFPDLAELIKIYLDREPLFEREEIEQQIDSALSIEVPLPSGGSLIIEETSALTAVDVNTGSVSRGRNDEAFFTERNLVAAEELARQVRLRNLGGQLIIDFVNMRQNENRERVVNTLQAAVADDPCECFVGGFTRFGLLEMTRRRRGESLQHLLVGSSNESTHAAKAKSTETKSFELMRALSREARYSGCSRYLINVDAGICELLQGSLAQVFRPMCQMIGDIELLVSSELPYAGFEIVPKVSVGEI